MSENTDLTIFVSCFNEDFSILRTLQKVEKVLSELNISSEIIIIDDGSSDKSCTQIQRFLKSTAINCFFINRKKNFGLSKNLVYACSIAKGKRFRWVCGDDTEPYKTHKAILSNFKNADILIPYHTKVSGKSFARKCLSKIFTFLVVVFSGHKIRYFNGSPVAWTDDFKKYCRPKLGFSFQADFITQILDLNKNFMELPVEARERQFGRSTAISFKNLLGSIHLFRRLIKRRVIRFSKLLKDK